MKRARFMKRANAVAVEDSDDESEKDDKKEDTSFE